MKKFEGNIVDVKGGEIFPGVLEISEGRIHDIRRINKGKFDEYILPGFVDSHIHIESTMLTPSRFAQVVVPHGTVAIVTDPHEMANVAGMEGIEFMKRDASSVPLKVYFTAPSCVPATPFETNGATLGPREVDELLSMDDVVALGEVMNYRGVINEDPDVLEKIALAKEHGKPVDGHCPGLSGKELEKYVSAGISTDHECTTFKEAEEKARLGMKIMIREGSSARNLEALASLDAEGFLVSDDKHLGDLLSGHMNSILAKAVRLGIEPIRAIRMASLNPVNHYGLRVGLLRIGDPADFVVVDGLESFRVKEVWIDGKRGAVEGIPIFSVNPLAPVNVFNVPERSPSDFEIRSKQSHVGVRVINIMEGEILTKEYETVLDVADENVRPSIEKDVLKLSVVNRYTGREMANAFVKGFGIKKGAFASSVSHDSHNIIVVGADEWDMAIAVNVVSKLRGGLVAVYDRRVLAVVRLPYGGLMSGFEPDALAKELKKLHTAAKAMGCKLSSPFMALSFLSLLVIPKLRLSDRGLFDVEKFGFVELFT
jgi:adenine deaminase